MSMKYSLAITKKTLKEYLDILPISYYLKTKIECDITDENISYFDRNNHKIMISIKMLNGLKYDHRPTNKEIEKDIRCMLYHELSHAILTPNEPIKIRQDIYNVFEDERIETLLSAYFINVNFKEFVKRINNYTEDTKPKSLYQYFYFVVRFRTGPKELIELINEIIYKARYFTSKYTVHHLDAWKGKCYNFENYQTDIYKLYILCKKHFDSLGYQEAKDNVENDNNTSTIIVQSSNPTDEERELKKKENDIDDNVQESFKKPYVEHNFIKTRQKIEANMSNFDEMCAWNNASARDLEKDILEYIKDSIRCGQEVGNKEFKNLLRPIILRYKGSMKQNGGSRTSYSGRLNPRLTINNDFKWFEKSGGNSIKRGVKLQLNLFIDRSNSFSNNENNVNNMLYELDNLEKELSNIFEYNLITMGHSIDIAKKNARRIQCNNGTTLNANWKKTIEKMQNPNNDCINIILFDGKVYDKKDKHLFKMFNKNNFIIISDIENSPAIKQYCKDVRKVIIANEGCYVDSLLSNIIKVLNMAIR